ASLRQVEIAVGSVRENRATRALRSNFVPHSLDAKCLLLLKNLAWVRLFRRARCVLGLLRKDFSFIPGLLRGEKGDWSLRYFSAPAVVTLFYTNPLLPGLAVLFGGLFCLDHYMHERSRAWLLLTALLFVALVEVKMLMAAQLICSLGVAAVVYLIFFSNA